MSVGYFGCVGVVGVYETLFWVGGCKRGWVARYFGWLEEGGKLFCGFGWVEVSWVMTVLITFLFLYN